MKKTISNLRKELECAKENGAGRVSISVQDLEEMLRTAEAGPQSVPVEAAQ